MQARSQAIEAQLASTTAELQALKTRHQELETKLERASQANQDSVGQSGPSKVHPLLGVPVPVTLFFE